MQFLILHIAKRSFIVKYAVFFFKGYKIVLNSLIIAVLSVVFGSVTVSAEVNADKVCNAIYWAEGGHTTRHPYGILKKYKTTTPRQACINTVVNKYKAWVKLGSKGQFIDYLGSKYCPVGSDTDDGTCRYWTKNVKYFIKINKGI